MVPTSQRLRTEHDALWERCVAHPFVLAIGRGDLEEERFRRFLVQDFLFLTEYSRVLAYASAKGPDLEAQKWFAKLLESVLCTEMDAHRKMCSEWGIGGSELADAEPLPTTIAYTSFLLRVAASADIGDLASSLLPCQWGYADVGVRLKRSGLPSHVRYASWISSYADPGYVGLTEWLRGFVDTLGGSNDESTYARWSRTFQTTLRYELAFWEMAWAGERWPA